MTIAAAVTAVLLSVAAGVQAQSTVSLSRATVELGAGTWIELGRAKRVVATVERRADLVAEVVASALIDGDRLRAVAIVTSTPTGVGRRLDWAHACAASSELAWSTALKGGHPEDIECAEATAPGDAATMLDSMGLGDAVQAHAPTVPGTMVSVSSDIFTRFGRMMSVQLLADAAFVGLPGGEPGPVPAQVKVAHAAYALELGKRVRGSLFSIRGKMDVPPIGFAAVSARP